MINERRAVLVTGSRDWADEATLRSALDDVLRDSSEFTVIEGRARGADAMAGHWAIANLLPEHHLKFPADWDKYGPRRAGHIRNAEMLKRLLELRDDGVAVRVFAFKNDFDETLSRGGTENMVKISMHAGVGCWLFCSSEDPKRLEPR